MAKIKSSKSAPLDARLMRITAAWGKRFRIQAVEERRAEESHQARTRGKKLRPVCGDKVLASPIEGESDWLIHSIEPRERSLTRPDSRGRSETLAANMDLIVVVAAVEPSADFFIVDRYLAAAELMGCDAILVWNKSDLQLALAPELKDYEAIGYQVLEVSSTSGHGIKALASALGGHTGIFVGQSGVGKSSLINALGGEQRQKTGEVSTSSREGRHTTVAAELLRLSDDIEVIDSPGVRDYAPSIAELRDVALGFREIDSLSRRCRFANCEHRAEPDCAVKGALETGELAQRRYKSYLRLLQLTRQLAPSH